jgi:hypothetical protein
LSESQAVNKAQAFIPTDYAGKVSKELFGIKNKRYKPFIMVWH